MPVVIMTATGGRLVTGPSHDNYSVCPEASSKQVIRNDSGCVSVTDARLKLLNSSMV